VHADNDTSRIIQTPRSARRRGSTPDERQGGPAALATARRRPPGHAPHPAQIGRFPVIKPLGQGGMGIVYTCYDDQLDRKIAVKVLHEERVRNHDHATARLRREAQAMAKLSHPHIVTVHEVGEADGLVYVAMEFVAGASLDVWAAEPRPWRDVLAALLQAGRGLEAAHRAGLVHRDFKPQNVMISPGGLVKVLDFGLARTDGRPPEEFLTSEPDGGPAHGDLLLQPLTRTGVLVGTPAYMAPEQHRGEVATAASDQFSFCVSLYQCTYGALPFSITSLEALQTDVLAGRIAPPPLRSEVPMHLFRALRRGMAPNVEDRFPSMSELLVELARDPGRALRRASLTMAIAGAAAAVSFTVAEASAPAPAFCPDAQAELADVWDPARAGEAGASLRAREPEEAEPWIKLITPQLDRYAEAWARMRNEACQTHRDGRQSDLLFDLRTACLDRRLAGLDALADTFAAADPAALPDIARAVIELPRLDGCADVDALTAELPPPDGLRARVTVARLRQSLARADVLRHAGQYQDGLVLVATIQKEADDLGYLPLIAETRLQAGDLAMESSNSAEAASALDAALWTALEAGHDGVAAQASAKRAYLRATQLGEVKGGLAELDLAAALNRHNQRDRETYAEYLHLAGAVHLVAADFAQARRRLEESLTVRSESGRVETWKGLETLAGLAKLAEEEGDYVGMVAAYRDVVALSARTLDKRHPAHVRYETALAIGLSRIGRTHEALRRLQELEPACRKIESRHACTFLLRMQANLALLVGDTEVGRASLERTLAVIPDSNIERDLVLADLMYVAGLGGDADAVHQQRQELVARQQARNEPFEGIDLYTQLRHAEALEALGRPSEALDVLLAVEADLVGATDVMRVQNSAETRLRLGTLRHRLGQDAEAKADLERALADLQRVAPAGSLPIAETLRMLGEVDLTLGSVAAAREHLVRSETLYAATAEAENLQLAQARFALARALVAGGSPIGQARSYAALAAGPLQENGRAAEAHAVEAWLAEHP
jgi:tetratricopeptide (TPR) repeat protein/tRNA A-37 threonylcarbamoyl transferase component Bud32